MDDVPADVLFQICTFLNEVLAVSASSKAMHSLLWRSTHADLVLWQAMARRYGSCGLQGRCWYDHLKNDLFGRFTTELRGRASVYGRGYVCVVHGLKLTRGCIQLDIHERGDNSLGPIQPWASSNLYSDCVTDLAIRSRGTPIPGSTHQLRGKGHHCLLPGAISR